MRAAPHSRNEERLATLRSYRILDTSQEADFDDIVSLAARICEVPISAVNLIDFDRQWFKAETGLGVREMPLDDSICAHAILEADFVEISDTLEDPRMADNPLVQREPGLRFYAGALLKAADGLPLGTLCVLDVKPRRLSELQINALRVLARQVVKLFDLRLALEAAEMLRIEADHRVKNSLQSAAALVRIEASRASGPEAKDALARSAARVATISALHELLGHSKEAGKIEAGEYIGRVVELVGNTRPSHVSVDVQAASFMLPSRTASALGMIVNELLMNAFKHAFPDDRPGRVTVQLLAPKAGMARLVISDDGVGMAAELSSGKNGLGSHVVRASITQIGGEIATETDASGGLRTTAIFPVPA